MIFTKPTDTDDDALQLLRVLEAQARAERLYGKRRLGLLFWGLVLEVIAKPSPGKEPAMDGGTAEVLPAALLAV